MNRSQLLNYHSLARQVKDLAAQNSPESHDRFFRLQEELIAIEEAIASLPSKLQQEILIHRYLYRLTWHQMTFKFGYSRSQLYRLHDEALKFFHDMK